MSERNHKWKEVGKTAQRLNSILGATRDLPSKFAPRDRSESVDKLFNSSRSRHSSMEMQILNQTREEETPLKSKLHQRQDILEKKQSQIFKDKKGSLLRNLTLEHHSSVGPENSHVAKSSSLVLEIKKQFWAFKQNVLKQLQKQKQMVNKLIKEVILTMELEFEKLYKRQNDEISSTKSNGSTAIHAHTKTIEEWKSKLSNIKLSSIDQAVSKDTPTKSATSPAKFLTVSDPQQPLILLPPKSSVDISLFLKSIQSLKAQFSDMDKILEVDRAKDK